MVDIKTTSNAAWWIKNPKKQRTQAWGTKLCQDMTDLFRHISLHGYNKLFDGGLLFYEKLIWLCVHVVIFAFMFIALTFTWDQYVLQYFSINLHDPLYPIERVPFPAVSICSNNRISHQAAEQYAHELSQLDPKSNSKDYYMERIKYFRSFSYRFERHDDFEAFAHFQKFLDDYGTEDNQTFYNVLNVMKKLTPSCKDFINLCALGGKIIDCNAFRTSLTVYGLCCTFTVENANSIRSYRTRFAGADMGLIVVLNSTHEDDTVSLLNMDGYAVIIHTPNNFPDVSSGNSIEIFPINNKEAFLAVKARSMDTEQSLRTFSPIHRQCYFDDESPFESILKDNRYSLSSCISRCRMRSIAALCNCIPYYIPSRMHASFHGVPFCTLSYIECLQRYQFKWRNVLTKRVDIVGMERENEEALYCPHCLPSCDDVRYEISMMSLPADRFSLPEGIDVSNFTFNITDMSVLRVFFGESTSIFYKRVIVNTWVEALSTVGNIVSICMGFSLVALLEIFYFSLKYLLVAIRKVINDSSSNSKKRKNSQLDPTKLNIYP